MSHVPPNGPPYYYPGAPPPQAGGFAYVPVPAPMMMPVYHAPPHHPPPHHPPPHHPHPHYPPPHHPPPHYPPPEHHYPPPPPTPAQEHTTYVTNYVYQQPPQPEPTVTVIETPAPAPAINVPKPWQAIAGIAETCLSEVNKMIANNQQTTTHVFSEAPVAEPSIDWVPATTSSAASFTHRAFVGGKEGWDGSPLWIIRAHHSGEFVPGKLSVKQRAAFIPHGGREIPVHNFEILCAPQNSLRWVPASNGQVPVGAIPAGNTHNAEPLYIARCRHMRSSTPGKVHPSHGTAYISYGGSEITYRSYEVLCKIVG